MQGTIRLAEMHWQPYASTVNPQEVQAAVKAVSEHEGPPKHCHDAMAGRHTLPYQLTLSHSSKCLNLFICASQQNW